MTKRHIIVAGGDHFAVTVDFTDIEARLKWADEQINQLIGRFPAFRERKPHEIVVKPNPGQAPDHFAQCLQINEPAASEVIGEVALRTGDVIHSLRAALDYLAYLVVPNPTVNTAFPVWRSDKHPIPTPAQYKGCVLGKVKGAPPGFIKLCLGIQPYFGGTHEAIRVLDYLDIVDKHRMVIEAFAAYKSVNLDFAGMMRGWEHVPADLPELRLGLVPAEQFPLTDGYVLFSAPLDMIKKMDAQPQIEIALGEPKPFAGRSVVPALTELAQFVRDLIDQFRRVF
jgi:hypothetical protein